MKVDHPKYKILFISPGASITGGPVLFLRMMDWLRNNASIEAVILTLGEGELMNEYLSFGKTFRWDFIPEHSKLEKHYLYRLLRRIAVKAGFVRKRNYQKELLISLGKENFDLIYANTVASFEMLFLVKSYIKCPVVSHIRELEISIKQFCGIELFNKVHPCINLFIADSEAVKQNLVINHGISEGKIRVVYEYIKLEEAEKIAATFNKDRIEKHKAQLGLPRDAFVVVSSGTTDWRKGADLFVRIAAKVVRQTRMCYFIWVGGENSGLQYEKLMYDAQKTRIENNVRFLGIKKNPLEYFVLSDLFMLCSREEPVGVVALEAAALGKPVLCFEDAGGMPEFVRKGAGYVIPYLDVDAMADAILQLSKNDNTLKKLGNNARSLVKDNDISVAGPKILEILFSVI